MIALVPYRPAFAPNCLAVWQAAFGDRFPITTDLWRASTEGDPDFRPDDMLVAQANGETVGLVMTKRYRGDFPGCERFRQVGSIALLAVHPAHQRRGVASSLLAWAEDHLRAEGAERIGLGGSFQHVMPGVPRAADAAIACFTARGYAFGRPIWDVKRNVATGPALPDVAATEARADATIRPFEPGEEARLGAFLATAVPGRWARDVACDLARGVPIRQIMGLFLGDRPLGFACLHPPGSSGALRWAGFAPHMAALGPIGVDASLRGQGLGLALLVRGLEHLQRLGATDTVIDWTDLLAFYARCGFEPWLGYLPGSLELGA